MINSLITTCFVEVLIESFRRQKYKFNLLLIVANFLLFGYSLAWLERTILSS